MSQLPAARLIGVVLGASVAVVLVATASTTLGAAPAAAAPRASGAAVAPSAPQASVRRAPASRAIAGQYIVTFKDGSRSKAATVRAAQDLTARRHGKLRHTFTSTMRGFSAALTEAQARSLATDPTVASVEQDAQVWATDTQNSAPWSLDRIDQRTLPLTGSYTYATRATNVSAYILDTGIRTTHAEFGGRAKSAWDFVDNDADASDCNGHGTHVAATIGGSTYGVAKGAKLYAVRVLGCNGSGSVSGIIAGIDWVTAHAVKPAVANLSLGASASTALDAAVRRSIAAGITYAIAAGNENVDACQSSPARTAEAITVGATTSQDARASYSNYGSCVDLFAPGSGVTSAWYTSNTATATLNGTSMATPHVAGAAALYLADHPTATPAQVAQALIARATTNVVTDAKAGSPNRLLYALDAAGAQVPATIPTPTPSPTAAPTPVRFFENQADSDIPDTGAWVYSPITVTGLTGSAPTALKVSVAIKHPYRGDLVVELVGPNGAAYRLKNYSGYDFAPDVIATYTVSASSQPANGTWKLRARDVYDGDSGRIDGWSLQF